MGTKSKFAGGAIITIYFGISIVVIILPFTFKGYAFGYFSQLSDILRAEIP